MTQSKEPKFYIMLSAFFRKHAKMSPVLMLNVNHRAGWKEGLGVWLSGACLAFIGPVSVPSKNEVELQQTAALSPLQREESSVT